MELVTLSDTVNALVDRSMSEPSNSRTVRLLTSAVQQAMRDLPKKNKWKHYIETLRFTAESQTEHEVAYTESNRTMVITGDTEWSDNVTSGEIIIGNTPYEVAERTDDTTIVLTAGQSIGDDYTGDVSWQRSRYTFSRTFTRMHYLVNLTNRLTVSYMEPSEFYERNRLVRFSGVPAFYTVRGSAARDTTDIVLSPVATESTVFEAMVTASPIIPRIYQMIANDGAIASGAKAFTSASADFTGECVGAVLRIYSSEDDIPFGRPIFESMITARSSATALTLETAADQTYSGATYVVSSLMDIEPGLMLTMVEDMAYENYCQNHDHKGLAQAAAIAYRSLMQAIAADSKVNMSRDGTSLAAMAAAGIGQTGQVRW